MISWYDITGLAKRGLKTKCPSIKSPEASGLLKIQILEYLIMLWFEFFARLEFELYRANT
jgi:hypothetical protein